jgi:hypothetical protein
MDPKDEFLGNEESDDMEDDAEKIELYDDCESMEFFCSVNNGFAWSSTSEGRSRSRSVIGSSLLEDSLLKLEGTLRDTKSPGPGELFLEEENEASEDGGGSLMRPGVDCEFGCDRGWDAIGPESEPGSDLDWVPITGTSAPEGVTGR